VLDAKTGKVVWQKNLVQEYKATIRGGMPARIRCSTATASCSPRVRRPRGGVRPGHRQGIWRSPNPGKDVMSHVSLMATTIGGVKQYLYLTMNKVVGIAAADGALLWQIRSR